jgi:hypothetical protein
VALRGDGPRTSQASKTTAVIGNPSRWKSLTIPQSEKGELINGFLLRKQYGCFQTSI